MIPLPINIKSDSEYLLELNKCYKSFKKEISGHFDKTQCGKINKVCKLILASIKSYYFSDLSKALLKIDQTINSIINDVPEIVSNLSDIYKKNPNNPNVFNSKFYKARKSLTTRSFTADEMLHIPYTKREIIDTQRFSIPGTPCIYVGKTSYICWLELNKPAYNEFNVSVVKIDSQKRILNLAYANKEIILDAIKSDLPFAFKLCMVYPLIIATSFVVETDINRKFKSEYIISQLITQKVIQRKIDGIAYFSKKIEDINTFDPITLCLAFPCKYKEGEEFTKDKEHYKTSCSINYAEFLAIPQNELGAPSLIFYDGGQCKVANGWINYSSMDFSRFDSFLANKKNGNE